MIVHEEVPVAPASVNVAFMATNPVHGGKALKLHEYLAAGLPLIIMGPGEPWISALGAAAFHVASAAPRALTELLMDLAQDRRLVEQGSAAAVAYDVRDWQDAAEETLTLLTQAAGRQQPVPTSRP